MAIYRLLCAFGQARVVSVLTRCSLPLPQYLIADEKQRTCLAEKIYLSQSTLLKVFALGQKLRRFAERVSKRAGTANGERVREWISKKKAGWVVVFRDPAMPATSTFLDQAHNAIDRKRFMMKGFHHSEGRQKVFLTGLALLYNFVPYQRRAKHAGKCRVDVEGGTVPTNNWFLNLQILTSGGGNDFTTKLLGMWRFGRR